jgi:hypothetical protein
MRLFGRFNRALTLLSCTALAALTKRRQSTTLVAGSTMPDRLLMGIPDLRIMR